MESPTDESRRNAQFATWLAAARRGNHEALGQLLDSDRRYLIWLASHELGQDVKTKQAPSDVVQDAFLRAQASFEQFHGTTEAEFKGWLRRILLNSLANTHRRYRAAAKREVGREMPLPIQTESALPAFGELEADGSSPSNRYLQDEETQELLAAIERLPVDYQQVLTLRHWDRLSFEEIGRRMSRSANAASKLWGRAFARLERDMRHRAHERSR